jgi:hypothetical protein
MQGMNPMMTSYYPSAWPMNAPMNGTINGRLSGGPPPPFGVTGVTPLNTVGPFLAQTDQYQTDEDWNPIPVNSMGMLISEISCSL